MLRPMSMYNLSFNFFFLLNLKSQAQIYKHLSGIQKRAFAPRILYHQNRYALPQKNDSSRAGRSMPKVCGIMTLPEEHFAHFYMLYIYLWITFASVRVSLY
jgi:hypothetical protein